MITVTRKNVWNDLKRYYAHLSHYDELQLPLKVEFVDEMAIDEGGPSVQRYNRYCSIGMQQV